MKKTFTPIALMFVIQTATGQCSTVVPASAQVVTTMATMPTSASGQTFWICDNASVIVLGGGNTFFIEGLGSAEVHGDGNNLRAKGEVAVFGDDNAIFTSDVGSVFEDGNNTVNECPVGVTFNYVSAPAGGCVTIGIEDLSAPILLEIIPNPVVDHLIFVAEETKILSVQLFDVSGTRVIYDDRITNSTISVSALPIGLYVAVVQTDQGAVVRKVFKER